MSLKKIEHEILQDCLTSAQMEMKRFLKTEKPKKIRKVLLTFHKASLSEIYEDVESATKEVNKLLTLNIRKTKSEYSIEVHSAKIAIHCHQIILTMLGENFLVKDSKKKFSNLNEHGRQTFTFLGYLYFDIVYSLNESLIFFLKGRNLQAETLFRNFSELLDVGILCLLDKNFWKIYKEMPSMEAEEKSHWYKTKPSTIHKKIEDILNDTKLPEEYLRIVIDFRKNIYSVYSGSAHGKFGAVVSSIFNGQKSTESFFMYRFVFYNYSMIFVLIFAFIKFHHAPMIMFGDLGIEFTNKFKYLEKLNRVCIERQLLREKEK